LTSYSFNHEVVYFAALWSNIICMLQQSSI